MKHGIFSNIDIRHRIQHTATGTISLAVVLLLITDVGVLSNMECVDAVMSALVASAVVDSAARDDGHVRAVRDIKVVVYKVCHAGNADNYRDIDFLTLCIAVDIDIDARLIRFLLNLNMLTVTVADGCSVLAQVESAFLGKSVVVDDL